MGYSRKIIEKFGGGYALSKLLGHKHPSKVYYWKETGRIPQKHWSVLKDLAVEQGFELTAEDFVDFDRCA